MLSLQLIRERGRSKRLYSQVHLPLPPPPEPQKAEPAASAQQSIKRVHLEDKPEDKGKVVSLPILAEDIKPLNLPVPEEKKEEPSTFPIEQYQDLIISLDQTSLMNLLDILRGKKNDERPKDKTKRISTSNII